MSEEEVNGDSVLNTKVNGGNRFFLLLEGISTGVNHLGTT